ncbi:ABC transporter ATP-binding protein [Streptomyces filamentosus]|uniref:ABC transporter ATP-binding protein n=1 Tax=Streptomyces filamentosus TaxID=67294 RepID=UPI0033FA643E
MSRPTAALPVVLGLAWRAAPGPLVGVLVAALVVAQLPVAAAWATAAVLDVVAAGGEPARVVAPAALLAGAGTATALLPHLDELLRGELSRAVALHAQDRLYAVVNSFAGLGRFEDPAQLDRLRLAQGCGQEAPPQIVTGGIGLLRAAVTVTGFLASLAVVSWWLVAVVVLSAVPALVVELRMARVWARTVLRVTPLERRELFYGQLLADVQAAKEIRLFGTGDHLRARMRADRRVIDAAHRADERRNAVAQAVPAAVSAAVSAAGLLWAVREAAHGRLSVGDVTLAVAATAAVQGGLGTAAAQLAVVKRSLVLFGHFTEVVGQPPDLPAPAPQDRPAPLRRGIELRGVSFRYSDRHDWVLRDVNLTLPAGTSLAVVGDNGAGKSTLVKLLCRFYDPTHGTVTWDGRDIRTFAPEELRRRISAVFQDFMRYDLTAGENIGLGAPDADGDPARVRAAAVRAGADALVEGLPHGYDTMLGRSFSGPGDDPDDGVELSGGQWQRVALARSLVDTGADLLILDEPTSGLDPEAEQEVQEVLARHRRGRTSLLISHRLSAARGADRIVVLRGGRVVEQGDHDTLMAADGRYARLFARQAAGYADVPAAGAAGRSGVAGPGADA